MEPGQKAIRRLLRLVLTIFAFIIAVVLGEYSFHGFGWMGPLVLFNVDRVDPCVRILKRFDHAPQYVKQLTGASCGFT
jgi:hypothetical protein